MTVDAKIYSVKRETASINSPDVDISGVKQEAIYAHNTPQVEISGVKQETLAIYETPTIQMSGVKHEVYFDARVSNRIAAIKQEVLLSNQGDGPIPPDPPPIGSRPPIPNTYRPLDNPPLNPPCIPAPRSRFRRFWATQPNVCPAEPGDCSPACEQPGLSLMVTVDPTWQQLTCAYDGKGGLGDGCAPPITGATISTENYVRGLVINILGTNAAQVPSICGNRPGQRLGYWLDSISDDKSGSSIRYVPTLGFTTAQAVQFVQMQAQSDLQKLVGYGVANQVTVTASYVGGGTIGLKIIVEGVDDQTTVVNSTMTKISNAWVWNS